MVKDLIVSHIKMFQLFPFNLNLVLYLVEFHIEFELLNFKKRWINVNLKNIIKNIMKFIFLTIYIIFVLALVISGITFGIITLIPDDASKPCYLRYYAHCSFTPYSTIILFIMALVGAILLMKLVKYFKRKYVKSLETNPKFQLSKKSTLK